MAPAVATFALVLGIVLGAYWVFILRPENREHASLKARLKSPSSQARAMRLGVLKDDPRRLSAVGPLDKALGQIKGLSSPLQTLLNQSGLRWTVGSLVLGSGCCGLLAFLLVTHLTGSLLLGLAAMALAAMLPYAYVSWTRTRRLLAFEEHFPEAVDLIARALRAGHTFPTGLSMVGDEAPEPVRSEFKTLYEQQNFGMPLPEALRSFAARVPVLDARFFATAVLTQRESGGNLAEVLDNLSAVIRERFKVKRQVRVLSAHGRITGVVLFFLPPALAIAMFFMNPSHILMLINDPLGVQMILGAIVLQIIGGLTIRKLVKIEY